MSDSGVRNLEQEPYKGIAAMKGNFIPTGIPTLDFAMNDLMPGRTTLIVGGTNEGKSTFVKQIIVNAVNLGNKVFVMSGEGDQEKLINELYQVVIGRNPENYDYIKINKRMHKEPKKETLTLLQKWHCGKLLLFSKGKSKINDIEELFKMIESEIVTNRHNLVVIDNLMSMLTAKAIEKNEKQGEFMQKCHELAERYCIHIVLVLHPNKEYRKGVELEIVHISGTSDLANKADNIIVISREYDEIIRANGIHGSIRLIKNRDYTELPRIDVNYDIETGLLLELKDGTIMRYKFNLGQKKEQNIIVQEQEQFALPFDL